MKNRRLLKFGIVVFFVVFCFSVFNKTIAATLPEYSGNPSDCELIEGSGERKIVAIFDGNPEPSPATVNLAKEAMLRVFKKLEPYKSYNNFSFYIDKQTRNYLVDSQFKNKADLNNILLRPSVLDYACGPAFLYVYFVKNIPKTGSYTYMDFPVIYIDLDQALTGTKKTGSQEPYIEQSLSGIIAHESGHAIGGINDEYPNSPWRQGSYWDLLFSNAVQTSEQRTCVHEPNSLYRSSADNKLYGLITVSGCFDPILNTFKTFYRPSQNSIMNIAWSTNRKFNIISCGYILAGLHSEPLEKNNAEKYWSQCCSTPGVDRQGIPGCAPTVSTTTATLRFPTDYICPVTKTSSLSFPPISSGSILFGKNVFFPYSRSSGWVDRFYINFFNINTKDVSTTTTDGAKVIPAGDLAYIPAGSSTVFEIGNIPYCVSARVDLQKSITSTSSPITSIGGIPTGSDYIVSSSTLQLEFPADNNCPAGFLNSTTLPASATTTVISAMWDIDLPFIPGSKTNVFKINGKDVSATTTDGAKLIPAGDLASIPANTAVKFETYTRYCDESDYERFTLQFRTTTGGPIACFFNCL